MLLSCLSPFLTRIQYQTAGSTKAAATESLHTSLCPFHRKAYPRPSNETPPLPEKARFLFVIPPLFSLPFITTTWKRLDEANHSKWTAVDKSDMVSVTRWRAPILSKWPLAIDFRPAVQSVSLLAGIPSPLIADNCGPVMDDDLFSKKTLNAEHTLTLFTRREETCIWQWQEIKMVVQIPGKYAVKSYYSILWDDLLRNRSISTRESCKCPAALLGIHGGTWNKPQKNYIKLLAKNNKACSNKTSMISPFLNQKPVHQSIDRPYKWYQLAPLCTERGVGCFRFVF